MPKVAKKNNKRQCSLPYGSAVAAKKKELRQNRLHTNQFHYFGIVIRKAVLKKISSAEVERDFSKYLAITRAVGTTKIQKPMLHNRVFSTCNKEDYLRLKAKAIDDE